MLRDRTLRLQFGHRLEAVCVLGTRLSVDVFGAAPPEAVNFSVKHSQDVSVEVISHDQSDLAPANGAKQWLLDPTTFLQIQMTQPSVETNDSKVTVGYYGENDKNPINQAGIFLTGIGISLDVDADHDGVVEKNNPKKATWTWGPDGQGAILLVNCDKENPFSSTEDCQDEKIFSKEDLEDMSRMILRTQGPGRLPAGYEMVLHIPISDSDKVGVFYLQNPFFGQRYIHILGRRKLSHVVKYTGGSAELEFFVEGLRFPDESFDGLVSVHVSLLEPMAEGIPQAPIFTDTVVFRVAPWIMTPNILPPVSVFVCRGPDFGYVTLEPLFEIVTSLDSFGNLEVSPPVSVHGKEYPLGRILVGSSFPTDQLPGQTDPGCGLWFTGSAFLPPPPLPPPPGYSGTDTKRVTINKVLSNDIMVQENQYVQRCIDWNRDILKKELGLKEKDIVDLPALFKIDKGGKAMAYFPNMVNMIVLSRDLGIPKPFGPIIEGECCLEQYVSSLLEPLGLACTFIDDISSYHKHLGEVHCGTNVQRKPFAFKWWNMVP
ncbi:protein-arginine deiminase type-2 [Pseudonaja textilis]|uniref:protein-arginine deiminase type-2 n=1 Tax=Pseudonaja textilis TaxID=8673 RepID=UPI000EAA3E13|nr:protein-arginine deiminase type-2 [Pseudonaja textilis]